VNWLMDKLAMFWFGLVMILGVAFLLAVFGAMGCLAYREFYPPPHDEVLKIPMGKIISARVVPGSFSTTEKMEITTEKGVVKVPRLGFVELDTDSWIIEYSDGDRRFFWEGVSKEQGYGF